jgi:hypothetical protein
MRNIMNVGYIAARPKTRARAKFLSPRIAAAALVIQAFSESRIRFRQYFGDTRQ